jgi:hypothetical protein
MIITNVKKLDEKFIPCRFEKRWSERHDYGSTTASEEMWECESLAEGEKLEQINIRSNSEEVCDRGCPGFEPVSVEICSKHGEFVFSCDGCENDFREEEHRERLEEENEIY